MNIDAIIFFGELDLLEIRLNELDPVVDYFVIVEACEAHTSMEKRQPTYLAKPEQWAEVTSKFSNKIVHDVLDELQPAYTDKTSGWLRENYHQAALWQPVKEMSTSPQDLVYCSYTDEIPRPDIFERYRASNVDSIIYPIQDLFYHDVNSYGGPWPYTHMGTVANYEAFGGTKGPRGYLDMPRPDQEACRKAGLTGFYGLPDGGWHFTSFMTIPELRKKLRTYAHSSDPHIISLSKMSDSELAHLMLSHHNLFTGAKLEERSSTDPRLPKYLLDNPEKFAHFHAAQLAKEYPV